jgi:transposase InsO family protein
MFNCAIARQTIPRHLSSDHDPLFRFHRWRANLRVLEVDEIKTIPGTPRSHALVERLIGTIRHEYLDRIWFWHRSDLERRLEDYKTFYNDQRCHTGLGGTTPARRNGAPAPPLAHLDSYRWRRHCDGLFQTPAAA